ncbi:hypothetical protein [Actinacidiphila glaucinigra]|uniref:hypothetical protein n=1 Tax=Actinacidiphila glaucinigra TaxID=235986 RepID=UPI003D91A82C
MTRRHETAISLPPPPDLSDVIRLLTTLPESVDLQLPCGVWWDIVVTRGTSTGQDLIWWMRRNQPGGCGAVVADDDHSLLLWLVPATGSRGWLYPGGVWVSRPVEIVLPSLHRIAGPGPYWATSLAFGHLTDPRFLRAGLDHLGMTDPPDTGKALPELPQGD